MRLIKRFGFFGLCAAVFHHYLGAAIAETFSFYTKGAVKGFLKNSGDRPTIVMISTLDWYFPFAQRTHHLTKALSELDWLVIFVSPSAGYDQYFFSRRLAENILLVKNLEISLQNIETPIVYLSSADNRFDLSLLDGITQKKGRVIYDYIDAVDDALANTPMTEDSKILHETLLSDTQNVLVTTTAASILVEVKTIRSSNFDLVTNGVDISHFKVERDKRNLNEAFAKIVERKKPVIGYYGALASWVDYALLTELAKTCPDFEIVLIGPDYDGSLSRAELDSENLHILEPIAYDELPRHAIWFDVAIIPFLLNDITDATSPLKLFEYMALEVQIVATNIPEAHKYSCVQVASDHETFCKTVRHCIERGALDEHRKALVLEAQKNDWSAKATALQNLVENSQ